MSREFDRAVAAEVRAEVARQGLSRSEVERMAGIESRTWSRYFVSVQRDMPLKVLVSVAQVLGVSTSELMARAEANMPQEPTDELIEGLSPAERREVARARRARGIDG